MARDTAFQQVLEAAINKAQKDVPEHMFFFDNDGNTYGLPSQNVMRGLSNMFVENGVLSHDASPLTHASAFALRVLNSIDATRKIQKSIDFFMDSDRVKDWLTKQGISTDEEKQQLREDLKNHVEEQLKVKTKSDESKEFVERMTDAYDEYAKVGKADEFLGTGCAFLRQVNEQLSIPRISLDRDEDSIHQAKLNWEKYGDKVAEHSEIILDPMYDALSHFSKELSNEITDDLTHDVVQHYRLYFGDSVKVKPADFLEHAKTGEFTAEDKMWAQQRYEGLIAQGEYVSLEMNDLMVNGKPMFSEEQLKNTSKEELTCKLVENMLKGEDVAVKKSGWDQPEHIDVQLTEVENNKGFFQRLYDFIKDLLNPGAKEKAAQKQQNLADNLQNKKSENKAFRQRISFEELSGKNAAGKINTAPPKDKQLSAEHKLEKGGMSAGK